MNDLIYNRASDVLRPGEPIDRDGNGRRGGEADWHKAFAGGDGEWHPEYGPDDSRITFTPFVLRPPHLVPRRGWLYGRHYIRKFCSATIATGGLGKSSLVLVEAIAAASGRCLLRDKPRGLLRVCYINFEDPADELERRVQAVTRHYGLTNDDLRGRLTLISGRDCEIVLAKPGRDGIEINERIFDDLLGEILDKEIDILIFDPFAAAHRLPENDNIMIDAVVRRTARLADQGNCAIEFVHHSRKALAGSGPDEPSMDEARGASSFAAGVRAGRVLRRMTPHEGAKAGVDNHAQFFRTYSAKANMSPPSDKSEWYRLISIDVGNGSKDEPSDYVGVVVTWEMPDAFKGITADDLLRVQQAVDGKTYRASSQAADWVGKAVAQVLGLNVEDKKDHTRIKSLVKAWIGNGALVVTNSMDAKGKSRPIIEVGNWALWSKHPHLKNRGGEKWGSGGGAPQYSTTLYRPHTPTFYRGVGVGVDEVLV
jgi:hypothetical protein